jgi:hypothetical protein
MRSTANRWMAAVGFPLLATASARAEDSLGFSHETYAEDHSRMKVNTEAMRLQLTLAPWADVTVRGVYDAISGATPTGAPAIDQLTMRKPITHEPVPNSSITGFTRLIDGVTSASQVAGAHLKPGDIPLADSHDIRRGGDIAFGLTVGPSKFTPSFSYSNETDYISWAGGLTYALELNDKNTILSVGWSHAYDQILDNEFTYITSRQIKNTDEFLVGVTQVLGPETLLTLTGTIGHANGYLNDPYRSVVFNESALDPNGQVVLQGEKRPPTRDSQALLLTITQAVKPLDASVEGSYRFYHDSYGITANTFEVDWFQKLGRLTVLSPSVRYYRQSAARFYDIQFPGDPGFEPERVPAYYSSDYRLSALDTVTLGIEATIHIGEQCDLRVGYQRYWMHGRDHETKQLVYPDANIFTVGLTYRF